MKNYKIVNKTRFYIFIIVSIYIVFSAISFFKSFGIAESNETALKYEEVYINEGDTIWNIALEYKPENYDVRDLVAIIRDENKLEDLNIKPGEIIRVPIRKKQTD